MITCGGFSRLVGRGGAAAAADSTNAALSSTAAALSGRGAIEVEQGRTPNRITLSRHIMKFISR
jgi:hypothetical protein